MSRPLQPSLSGRIATSTSGVDAIWPGFLQLSLEESLKRNNDSHQEVKRGGVTGKLRHASLPEVVHDSTGCCKDIHCWFCGITILKKRSMCSFVLLGNIPCIGWC
ncbi:hypothetical protein CDAR_198271 [Caerostris darwini]|uniref:Uncharacterized protein n=1 Tax=Caerostris darwini TaxID=1538125 RepID=A0AAV4RS81_9ARAC|nr:hypothetical protein CDAR_198271 [Caerostris darwini]